MAVDLAVGTVIAVRDPFAPVSRACRVERVRRRPNGSVFVSVVPLHGPRIGTSWRLVLRGDKPVAVLGGHYGICGGCGGLAPCADELAEVRARMAADAADPFHAIVAANTPVLHERET
jgi:hypothetical protein